MKYREILKKKMMIPAYFFLGLAFVMLGLRIAGITGNTELLAFIAFMNLFIFSIYFPIYMILRKISAKLPRSSESEPEEVQGGNSKNQNR